MRKLILALIILFTVNSYSQKKKVETSKTETKGATSETKGDAEPDMGIMPVSDVPITKENNNNTIYNSASIEVKPEYPEAGVQSMYGFIRKNFVIPQEIIDGKETKTIFVSFIVEKDGSLSDIKVLRDVGYGTAEETIRVLKLMPKWLPGEQNGYHVRCMYSIPIRLNAY